MENRPIKDSVSEHNATVYLDMAKDMLKKGDGIYTFIIKVDGKNIVDCVQMDTVMFAQTIKWTTKL